MDRTFIDLEIIGFIIDLFWELSPSSGNQNKGQSRGSILLSFLLILYSWICALINNKKCACERIQVFIMEDS